VGKSLLPLIGRKPIPFTSEAAYPVLYRRAKVLRDAWLGETKHTRPGVPGGLPVANAKREAARLLEDYRIVDEAKVSQWSGYERLDFKVNGRASLLVRPKQAAKGSPWIWRTEFFGHEPQADIALLAQGYHVAYIDVQNTYGAPVAMDHMDALYDHLVQAHGLSKKVTLEGFSRGGLFAFNWAALHPERVASLYVDAPVCDFKSWPGGKGSGSGAPENWQQCLKAYGLSEAEAMTYPKNPVDQLAPLAKAGIPVLAVIGDADEVVPVSENINVVEKRYRELGGKIEVIRKPGGKHHPHSLPDPKPIVDFITAAATRE
jgi:pimeloyl-ACP methyl ester carboxylesterase